MLVVKVDKMDQVFKLDVLYPDFIGLVSLTGLRVPDLIVYVQAVVIELVNMVIDLDASYMVHEILSLL